MARKPGSTRARAVTPGRVHAASPPGFLFQPVRTRVLEELIEAGPQGPKVLSIVAPIGYGKTVLMSELHAHLQQAGEHCYWVGLDDRHASVERVLGSLKASITGPEADLHPIQVLLRGDEPIESRIEELIEYVTCLPAASTIFIDMVTR